MILSEKDLEEIKKLRNFKLLFCGIWIFVGTIFGLVSYFTYNSYKTKEANCTYEIDSYVMDIAVKETTDSEGDRSTSYYPVFCYTVDGLTYIKEYGYGSSNTNYHIGEEVNLLLNPNNYDEFLVVGDKTPQILFWVFGGVSAVCILIGLLTAIFLRYKPQSEIDEATDAFIKENTISRDQFETDYKDNGDSPFVK